MCVCSSVHTFVIQFKFLCSLTLNYRQALWHLLSYRNITCHHYHYLPLTSNQPVLRKSSPFFTSWKATCMWGSKRKEVERFRKAFESHIDSLPTELISILLFLLLFQALLFLILWLICLCCQMCLCLSYQAVGQQRVVVQKFVIGPVARLWTC